MSRNRTVKVVVAVLNAILRIDRMGRYSHLEVYRAGPVFAPV
jgi:hypothetical protein